MATETTELFLHRYEYRTQDEHGVWSEPEIRYANPTESEAWARLRHESCKDVDHEFGRKFEGSYGYSWRNCKLVKRTIVTTTIEDLLAEDSETALPSST
jgi:hypothetical protein